MLLQKMMYRIISAKLRPEDVLRTSPKDILWTSPDGPLCNAKGRLLMTSLGRWSMTSWQHASVTSWGRPHTALYITPWDVLYWHLEEVSCRRYEDAPIWSNICLHGTCSTDDLRGPSGMTWGRPKDVLI